ncbi:tRNA dihydrouridine synthase A [hydrothermal vent metagenome]|uniref:tRNA dihydrouridine synthase A n=1 Tax=hydrothermal vent metagenome TaxID=652676 RepID=A0A1W1BUB7_9ZZZZ
MKEYPHKFSIAPMLDWTDKHCRYFHRLISKKTQLWTEMVTTGAILFGDKNRYLDFNNEENPVVLQLGGSDVFDMTQCAKIAEDWGYDEININVGCPSDRVQKGAFGACLMKTPEVVAECVNAMGDEVKVPITVKSRIGVDEQESYEDLFNFVNIVSKAGCDTFVIHARKAWLKGLSPKENRTIPELKYNFVAQIKRDFPKLNIVINGGIKTLNEVSEHIKLVDGVMMGREIYHNPFILNKVDEKIYQQPKSEITREEVLEKMIIYIEKQMQIGVPIRAMTKHILGLYHSQPNSKEFKRLLSGKVVELSSVKNYLSLRLSR